MSIHMIDYITSLGSMLMLDAYLARMTLGVCRVDNMDDTIILRDKERNIIYSWDCAPSMAELDDVCRKLLKQGG